MVIHKTFLFLSLLILSGCTSSHNVFIRNMDAMSAHYNEYKGPRSEYAFIRDSNLTTITIDKDKNEIHHHKYYDRGFKKYCEYYIVVEPKGQTIIDWGFENNATSKYCEIRN